MTLRVAGAVVRRPSLWLPALRALRRVRAPGRLGPSLEWWEWRLHTAYGTRRRPEPADVIAWLRWCEAFRRTQ